MPSITIGDELFARISRNAQVLGHSVPKYLAQLINAQARSESAPELDEQTYRQLFMNTPVVNLIIDPSTGRIVDANPSAAVFYQYSRETLLTLRLQDLNALADADLFVEMDKALREKQLYSSAVHRLANNALCDVELYWSELTLAEKHYLNIVVIDISSRKLIEFFHQDTERRYQSVISAMSEGVVLHRQDGTIQSCNAAAERILGLSAAQLMGRSSIDPRWHVIHEDGSLFPGETHPSMVTLRTGLALTNVIMGVHRPDGILRWISVNSQPLLYHTEKKPYGVVVTFSDITEQKLAEDALRISEARLKSLADTQTTFVIRIDLQGRITYASHSYCTYLGLDKDDKQRLIGQPALESVYAEDHEGVRQAVEQCLAQPGTTAKVVLRKVHSNGQLGWTIWEFVAIQDVAGMPTEIQCIGFDITTQKAAEQASLEQARLKVNLQKERQFNSMVQRAISMLFHDARTPLTVIANAKYILERYYAQLSEEKRKEHFAAIDRQIAFMNNLLEDVVQWVKGSNAPLTLTPVSLPNLCQIMFSDSLGMFGKDHHFVFQIDSTIDTVLLDEVLVSRVLINLISNAVKFSPVGSEVRLEVSRRDEWLVLKVKDQGSGISRQDQSHIFEPFFRAKSVAHIHGTGLGLNIVKECVERHHGQIFVKSEVGKGSTFIVELPYQAA